MPELPEVETVARGLRPLWVGRSLARVRAHRPDLRTRLPARFAQRLEGRTVAAVDRRAKYLIVRFADGGEAMIAHLGMSGRLVRVGDNRPPAGLHDHLEFELSDGGLFRFCDPRRFGVVDLVAPGALAADRRFAGLGPEPLDGAFTADTLAAALAGRRTPMKAALLDQRTVAGLGNIYACEALFQAGISPRRLARTLRAPQVERLVAAIKDVLGRAIAAGGSSARDYVQASGELGWFQHHWAVYDREGAPCPGCDCSGAVRRIVQSGRSTFYCAKRQR